MYLTLNTLLLRKKTLDVPIIMTNCLAFVSHDICTCIYCIKIEIEKEIQKPFPPNQHQVAFSLKLTDKRKYTIVESEVSKEGLNYIIFFF